MTDCIRFHPDSLKESRIAMPVYLLDFYLDINLVQPNDSSEILNQQLRYTEKITLNHQQTDFGFSFVTPVFKKANDINANYQQIEIVSFTKYIGESFQSLAELKYIRLTIYSEITELYMDMDEEKYHQIISNLLSNAIKFTAESGKTILHLVQKENHLVIQELNT